MGAYPRALSRRAGSLRAPECGTFVLSASPPLAMHNARHPEPASGGASERRRRIFRFRRCVTRRERRRHSASRPVVLSGNGPVPATNRRNRKILRLRAPDARFAQNDPRLIIAKRQWRVFPSRTRMQGVRPRRIASAGFLAPLGMTVQLWFAGPTVIPSGARDPGATQRGPRTPSRRAVGPRASPPLAIINRPSS